MNTSINLPGAMTGIYATTKNVLKAHSTIAQDKVGDRHPGFTGAF
jgi:hypothetical protein